MMLSHDQKNLILNAESKALGTYYENINVVPVSTLFIDTEKIILCNYFMKKTLHNILKSADISLSCWSGIEGIQIKGTASYEVSGILFEKIQQKITALHPQRHLKGIIIINPRDIYDTSLTI